MPSPFRLQTDKGDNKPTRYYSSRQEKQIAKAVGGKTVKNSGATLFDKGDSPSSRNFCTVITRFSCANW